MPSKFKTVAFDLGGVIFSGSNDTNIFCKNYLNTPLTQGIYEVLKTLKNRKDIKLIIVSKAFPNNAKKSRECLTIHDIDMWFNSIIFCEKRESKFPICQAMGVDIMIDDRQDVLEHFDDSIRTILFTPEIVPQLLDMILGD